MFTGIIEETGTVIKSGTPLKIGCHIITDDINIGDSVAVNGTCLTVTAYDKNSVTLDVMNETFNRTSLKCIRVGSKVNLERAMSANNRFGGHIVTGHIDGTGKIKSVVRDGIAIIYTISADNNILKYIVKKGSVALDGISLTVVSASGTDFKVSVIPHTQSITTLYEKKQGDIINIEVDIIGKYVEKLIHHNDSKFDIEFLTNNGF